MSCPLPVKNLTACNAISWRGCEGSTTLQTMLVSRKVLTQHRERDFRAESHRQIKVEYTDDHEPMLRTRALSLPDHAIDDEAEAGGLYIAEWHHELRQHSPYALHLRSPECPGGGRGNRNQGVFSAISHDWNRCPTLT